MDFYVYIYYDPSRNHEPFYVGKGHGERAWCHLKKRKPTRSGQFTPFYNRLNAMAEGGVKPAIGLYSGMDEELAHLVEEEAIAKFGRRSEGTGSLWNLTKGGEGFRGVKHTEAARAKISASNRGSKSAHWTGKTLSEEHRANIRAGANPQACSTWSGKTLPEDHRSAISRGLKGHTCSPETRAKIGAKIRAARARRNQND